MQAWQSFTVVLKIKKFLYLFIFPRVKTLNWTLWNQTPCTFYLLSILFGCYSTTQSIFFNLFPLLSYSALWARKEIKRSPKTFVSFLLHIVTKSQQKKNEEGWSIKNVQGVSFKVFNMIIFSTSKNKTNKKIWLYLFKTTVIWSRTLFLRSLQF